MRVLSPRTSPVTAAVATLTALAAPRPPAR